VDVQLGMIGLGRMGSNMVRRLLAAGHDCVVADLDPEAVAATQSAGATPAESLEDLAAKLRPPRVVWLMVPAAAVGQTLDSMANHLEAGDVVVDGGNSYYGDSMARAARLERAGFAMVDVGVSGGVWGLDRGYCLMVGGDAAAVARLEPVLEALAPGVDAALRTPGRGGEVRPEERGWLHCGGPGAGHFVKMVHNGIEYGLMAAYAEGFEILRHANAGAADRPADAETAPLRDPDAFRFDLDVAAIAELWRRGSVIESWLLDLTAAALQADPDLAEFSGRVADSGEGRWTVRAAVDVGAPAPLLALALFQRFSSRGAGEFGQRLLSAMRKEFGGHVERPG
jgi:6-phosphogluconate dehydrogenase